MSTLCPRARASSSSSCSPIIGKKEEEPQETRAHARAVLAAYPLLNDRQRAILTNVAKQVRPPSESQRGLVMEIEREAQEAAQQADDESPRKAYSEVHGYWSIPSMRERLEAYERVLADGPQPELEERVTRLKERLAHAS